MDFDGWPHVSLNGLIQNEILESGTTEVVHCTKHFKNKNRIKNIRFFYNILNIKILILTQS